MSFSDRDGCDSIIVVTTSESLPTDLAAAHAMILAERAARLEAEALAASAKAEAANAKAAEALISYLKLEIEKLRRQIYGSRSERKARLLEQMELQLEELEATATEDELAAERAATKTQTVQSFKRKRPSRKPFPDHLPRERVVIPAPESCPCCGSSRLSKLGEDITETLEVVPRQWKVIQTVREKFSCRDCETITQPPAPFHVTPRGFAGPNLLAMILYDASRAQGPVTPALCWAHARRQFLELADIAANARRDKNAAAISPIALEAVKRIDALFEIERGINGQGAEERLWVRKEQSIPLLTALEAWLREQRARLSNSSSVAKPIDYMLRRWDRFARFIDDGRICLTNNAAERALRGFALGRRCWLFAGSERGADRAATMTTLIMTAKLNDVDPQAWLADVLARINDHASHRLDELLPWNWRKLVPSHAELA